MIISAEYKFSPTAYNLSVHKSDSFKVSEERVQGRAQVGGGGPGTSYGPPPEICAENPLKNPCKI